MTRKAARTGPGPVLVVALEQHFPKDVRIIDDELAARIIPLSARVSLWLKLRIMSVNNMVAWFEKRLPGMWAGFVCRKRYIDDKLVEATGSQVRAVVNMGAGFDTRAYRLPVLAGMPVWEMDQAEIIKPKRVRVKKMLGTIPANIKLVPVDFDRDMPGEVLSSYGYSNDERSFFLWEAVTQYLPEASVRRTFEFLDKVSPGSRLVFTYIQKDFIDGKVLYGHDYIYKNMVTGNKSWLFGIDPNEVDSFLAEYGWHLLEHLGYDELAEKYVKPTGRELLSTPLERVVYAEKRQR